MITTKSVIHKQKVGLWAIPKSQHQLEEDEDKFPFKFELYGTDAHWNDKAIHLEQVELTVPITDGMDLFQKALDTLELREKKAAETYKDTMDSIAEHRRTLLLLAAPQEHDDSVVDVQ